MADLATLQGWLTEAESARHQLSLGQSVVEVSRSGRRIAYTEASLPSLNSYIADLEAQIRRKEDEANGTTLSRRRSIGVVFRG